MPYSNIDKPSKYFDSLAYSGNSSTRSITDLNFKPDLLWIKSRSNATAHLWFDAVRGVSKRLVSNLTNAESTETTITSFDTNGWTMDADTGNNGSGRTYVAWNWLGANTTASNTQGSITSTVSANTTSGFSIVSWTASGSTSTVGHGLGVAPSMILFKDRSNDTNWFVYHKSVGATGALYLNATNSTVSNAIFFNNTAPTSSVFTVSTYLSASPHIAYCFAEVKGFSKFGSYTGNGSADGTFVYCGFRPAMVIRKRSDGVQDWLIHDNRRTGINQTSNYISTLKPNSSTDEISFNEIDILSNGFKMRDTGTHGNASGGTYIYMAFAESPFVSSKGIPTTAR